MNDTYLVVLRVKALQYLEYYLGRKKYALHNLISLLIKNTRVRGRSTDKFLKYYVSCLMSLRIYPNEIVSMILLSWKFINSYKLNASELMTVSLIFYSERQKNFLLILG